jgi:hypothetical protein
MICWGEMKKGSPPYRKKAWTAQNPTRFSSEHANIKLIAGMLRIQVPNEFQRIISLHHDELHCMNLRLAEEYLLVSKALQSELLGLSEQLHDSQIDPIAIGIYSWSLQSPKLAHLNYK